MLAVKVGSNEATVFGQKVERPGEVSIADWYRFWDGATGACPTPEIWEQRLGDVEDGAQAIAFEAGYSECQRETAELTRAFA